MFTRIYTSNASHYQKNRFPFLAKMNVNIDKTEKNKSNKQKERKQVSLFAL